MHRTQTPSRRELLAWGVSLQFLRGGSAPERPRILARDETGKGYTRADIDHIRRQMARCRPETRAIVVDAFGPELAPYLTSFNVVGAD